MYQNVCVCHGMPAIAERLRHAYPALPERAGVGSIPVEYIVSLSHILGKLQLIPAGDHTERPRLQQPPVLHQHVGHGLAQ
jgi:hypothetical protein